MISHRNLVNFCAGIDQCLTEKTVDTWLAVTSISFDISVLELLWTLTRGFQSRNPVRSETHRYGRRQNDRNEQEDRLQSLLLCE